MPKCAMGVIAVAFAAGILAVEYSLLPVCFVVAACGAVLFWGRATRPARGIAVVAAVAFAVGAARYAVAREVPTDDVSRFIGSANAIRGTVASDPDVREGRTRLVFKVDSANLRQTWTQVTGRVMVTAYKQGDTKPINFEYGDRAVIRTRPYSPSEPSNPGRFSWRKYLSRQRIYACAGIYSPEQVTRLPHRKGNPLVSLALRAKNGLTRSIQRVYPDLEGSIIVGMVMGTYSHLPTDTLRDFSRTGTMHLLAASGYNCYVLLFILQPILKAIRVMPKCRSLAVIAAILFYLAMAGAKPSLVRAAVMGSLLLLARPLKRVPNTPSLFFTAGLLILALNPGDLFDIGFQLSFLAVWALIFVSPLIGARAVLEWAGLVDTKPLAQRKTRQVVLKKIAGALATTAIATVAVTIVTAPVVAYYFNYVSIVALPANMAVELGVPLVFGFGFLSPIAAHVPWLSDVIGFLGTWFVRGMLWIVSSLGSWRYAAVSVASPSPLAIAGYYAVLYAALSYLATTVGLESKNAKQP